MSGIASWMRQPAADFVSIVLLKVLGLPVVPAVSFVDRYSNCPLCGGGRLSRSHRCDTYGIGLTWDRCHECSMVFQNPRLTEKALLGLYAASDYFGRKGDNKFGAYANYIHADPIRIEQSRRRMSRLMSVAQIREGRLLDVGSASGFFGVAATEAGFQVTCVEPDGELASYGRDLYRLDFRVGTVESCSLEREHFDIVTLWGTVSVLLHPLHSFETLVGALKPGGILAMNYQDFDHWIRLFFPGLMVGWNVMFNLTGRSLQVLLQRLGLTLLHHGPEWQTVAVDQLFRLLRLSAPSFVRKGSVRVPAISFPVVIARK
jgi:hypothetical protein